MRPIEKVTCFVFTILESNLCHSRFSPEKKKIKERKKKIRGVAAVTQAIPAVHAVRCIRKGLC